MLLCEFGIGSLTKHVGLFQMDNATKGGSARLVMLNSTDIRLAMLRTQDFINPAGEKPG